VREEERSRVALGARLAAISLAGAALSACVTVKLDPFSGGEHSSGGQRYAHGPLKTYSVAGKTYHPQVYRHYDKKGLASWYGYPAGTRQTASGEWFDGSRLTAAHKTLPLPCIVEVTNLDNGRKIKVRVNDRGPFVDGRIIDLTRAGAEKLGFIREGTARVRVKLLGPASQADSGGILMAQVDTSPKPATMADDEGMLF